MRFLVFVCLVLLPISALGDNVYVFIDPPPNQSNMFGYGTQWGATDEIGFKYPHFQPANILYNKNNTGSPTGLVDAWRTFNNTSAFGPNLSLVELIAEHYPVGTKLAFIEFSVGGASIEEFLPTAANKAFGHNYFWLWQQQYRQGIARILARGDAPIVVAAFTMHGENGCATPSKGNSYANYWRMLVQAVRNEVGDPSLPFIEGRIGDQMLQPAVVGGFVVSTIPYGACYNYTLYRRYMQGGPYPDPVDWDLTAPPVVPGAVEPCARYYLAAGDIELQDLNPLSDPLIACVDMDGLPTLHPGTSTDYHYNSSGYLSAGRRLFNALQLMLGW